MRSRIKTAKPRRSTVWRKRLAPICLCGISLASLLQLGWRHEVESLSENNYCLQLQYFLLGAYQAKHGAFPTNLDAVEKDYESHAYDGCVGYDSRDRRSIEATYRRYRPVMTDVDRSGAHVRMRVQFAGRYHNVYTVYQM